MQTPDPLPQPGAWIVTADGSLYEVARSAHDLDASLPCIHPPADRDGVRYVSVDSGEVIWTPWGDVEAVGTYDEVDAISDDITRDDVREAMRPRAPRPIAHTTRWEVAIYHAPGTVVPDHLRTAVQGIIQAALRVSGIDDAAVLITEEA